MRPMSAGIVAYGWTPTADIANVPEETLPSWLERTNRSQGSPYKIDRRCTIRGTLRYKWQRSAMNSLHPDNPGLTVVLHITDQDRQISGAGQSFRQIDFMQISSS